MKLSFEDIKDVDEDELSKMKWDVSTQTDFNMNQVEELVNLHDKVVNLEKKLEEVSLD